MIDVGDPIILTYPSKPASPATVNVTIGLPDGTTAGPFSAISGSYTYTTSQVGRHTVLWVATGPADAYSDVFDVAAADGGFIISLTDAKTHLRKTLSVSAEDEELRLHLGATTAVIESVIGPIVAVQHVEVVDARDTIVLAKAPVETVTSIIPFASWSSPFVPQYALDGPAGLLRVLPTFPFDHGFSVEMNYGGLVPMGLRLQITYTAGRPIVPAAVQLAARVVLADLWAERRGAMPLPPGGDQEIPAIAGDFVMSDKAVELLAPYARAPRIA